MFNGDDTRNADHVTARGSADRRWRIVAVRERLDGIKIQTVLGYADNREAAAKFAAAERAALRGSRVYYEPIDGGAA